MMGSGAEKGTGFIMVRQGYTSCADGSCCRQILSPLVVWPLSGCGTVMIGRRPSSGHRCEGVQVDICMCVGVYTRYKGDVTLVYTVADNIVFSVERIEWC